MDFALFTSEGTMFLLRWIHFLAGIMWIGLLYYFNFVQGEWFKEVDPTVKTAAIQKLVPRALFWFRWAAKVTFIVGILIYLMKGHQAGHEIYMTSWGLCITLGGILGTLMYLNVWLVIWPNQKILIAKAQGQPVEGDPAIAGAKAGLASRTNVLFSIPMLFFMGAASHLPISVDPDTNYGMLYGVLLAIVALLEINGLKGKMGPMATLKGVVTCGLILTAILYCVLEILV